MEGYKSFRNTANRLQEYVEEIHVFQYVHGICLLISRHVRVISYSPPRIHPISKLIMVMMIFHAIASKQVPPDSSNPCMPTLLYATAHVLNVRYTSA